MKTVTIDAGHGGKDSGAIGSRSNEKTHALAIALKVAAKLKAAGVKTVLTRSTDVFVELTQRSVISNNAKSDAFVSIHMNSSVNKTAGGTEVLYMSNVKDLPLARAIYPRLLTATGLSDRGVKYQNVSVVRKTNAPAILCEIGFINNPTEEKKLMDSLFQERVADAITQGVCQFLGIKKVASVTYELQRSDGSKMADLDVYDGTAYVEARKFGAWFKNVQVGYDMTRGKVLLNGDAVTTKVVDGIGYVPIREAANAAGLVLVVDSIKRVIMLSW